MERHGLSAGTAVRHFNVMHHMMGKAAMIWSKETGIDRNPADEVELRRPNDQRERYLSAEENRKPQGVIGWQDVPPGKQSHQSDVLQAAAAGADCTHDQHADCGDIRSEVERCTLPGRA